MVENLQEHGQRFLVILEEAFLADSRQQDEKQN